MSGFAFPVEAGHVMLFARSVGDPNPIYHDARYAAGSDVRGVIAPPTFVAAGAQFDPDYRLRPRPAQPWFGSGRTPSGADRPGDRLSVETEPGATWEKVSRRAGKLSFSETITRYRDETGDLVVTARLVRVITERPVGD